MSGTLETDEERLAPLVARARMGDAAAMDALLRAIQPRVRRWALARTGSSETADDTTQDALVRVYRYLRGFAGRSRFTSWLYRLTVRVADDRMNRQRRRPEKAVDPEALLERADAVSAQDARSRGDDPADAVDRQRTLELVRAFFHELPDRQREVFDLVDLQGYTPSEVAEMLDMKPVSVRASLLRARRTIRGRVLQLRPDLVEES